MTANPARPAPTPIRAGNAGESGALRTAVHDVHRRPVLRALERRLAAVLEIAARLAECRSSGEVLESVVRQADMLCPLDAAHFYRLDAEGQLFCVAHVVHRDGDCPTQEQPLVLGEGDVGGVAARGRRLVREPVVPIHGGSEGATPAALLLPLTGNGDVRGVLVLERSHRFTGEDVTILSVYAGLAGQTLSGAEQVERLDRQQRELEQVLSGQRRLLDVNERLLSNLDPREVLDLIADSLKAIVAYDNLSIYRVDREAGVFRAFLARDRFADLILAATVPIGKGITGWVYRNGVAVCANDAHLDPRTSLIPGTPSEAESLVVVPLRVAGEVVGTLNVGRMGEREAHFNPNEFELIKLFAGQASIALANADAQRALWARAETDALTGLRNRGSFEHDLDSILMVPDRVPVLLLMLDLDGFKIYNDRHGHRAGDRLLKAVGSAIGAAVGRGTGYRYGGDEFAIVLPNARPGDSAAICERVASGLAAATPAGDPVLTASVGAALYPQDASSKEALVAAADKALYGSKAGRGAPEPKAGG